MEELSPNQSIFQLLFSFTHRNPFFDWVVVFCAQYLPYILIAGFFVFAVSKKDHRARVFVLIEGVLAVVLSRGIIVESIRFFYEHPRPFAALGLSPLIQVPGDSFPSGHASIFFALATILYFFDKRAGSWFFAFALINGVARIIAGVHWPFDIASGIVVGIISGSLVYKFGKKSWEGLAKVGETQLIQSNK